VLSTLEKIRLAYWKLRVRWHLQRNDAHGALARAWQYTAATQLSGDYYEFGVYRGDSLASAWLAYRHSRRFLGQTDLPFEQIGGVAEFMIKSPTFYGFDTFAGMPDNHEGQDSLASGTFFAPMEVAAARCSAVGLEAPDLRLVKGLFADNADAIGDRPAAIIHLDCDLYASSRDALSLIHPRLVQGTVMLCDDYDLFLADNTKGQRRALREFSEATGITFETWFAYGAASRAFLCHVPGV
jgi:O-methyltransferase